MTAPVYVIYDGECPFCSAYVKMLRLTDAVGSVELLDARQPHPVVDQVRREGIDFDEGMAVRLEGRTIHGAEAMQWLSMMTTPSATLNGLMARLLRDERRARFAYPVLRAGRNFALTLLRRRRIGSSGAQPIE